MEFLFVLVVAYVFLGLVVLFREYKYIKRVGRLKISSLCRAMYAICLCIIPAIIVYGYDTGAVECPEESAWALYVAFLATVVVYVSFQFGYRARFGFRHENNVQETVIVQEGSERILLTCTILLLISIVSLVLWASGYGGISQLIVNANSIRASFVSSGNSFTFFKHFVCTSMICSLWIYTAFLQGNAEILCNRLSSFILFAISTVISFLFILANDGRMLAGIYLFFFVLIWLKDSYERKHMRIGKMMVALIVISVVTIILIMNVDVIFQLIRYGTAENATRSEGGIVATMNSEFSFIITSPMRAILTRNAESYPMTIANDVLNGLFAYLPTSLKPVQMENVWTINTLLGGGRKGATSPCTIVAQSVYDLGMIGVFIIPIIYGMIVRKIENRLEYKEGSFYMTINMVLGFYLAKGCVYFAFDNILLNVFFIVVGCFVHFLAQRTRISR